MLPMFCAVKFFHIVNRMGCFKLQISYDFLHALSSFAKLARDYFSINADRDFRYLNYLRNNRWSNLNFSILINSTLLYST